MGEEVAKYKPHTYKKKYKLYTYKKKAVLISPSSVSTGESSLKAGWNALKFGSAGASCVRSRIFFSTSWKRERKS